MVSLNTRLSTLALFNPSELLEFSVKLLNLPANGTHFLCITRRILRQVIGDDERVINHGGLRYKDEFVRHKVLDAVGDLALAGARFIGCYRSYRGGHKLNAQALRTLLLDQSAYEIVEPAPREKRGMMPEFVAVNAPAFAPWML